MNVVAKVFLVVVFITNAMRSAAFAQAPDTNGCTPQERSNRTLRNSDQKNAGVICPPNVDPAIKAPTPKTGDPPTIPLPSSPGGHQSEQPT
jgi:hypothetical protein